MCVFCLEYNLPGVENVRHGQHAEDEIDYSVVFVTPELGFDIIPAFRDHNAMVGHRDTKFAKNHVFPSSKFFH